MEKCMSFSRRAFMENGAILIATVGVSALAWSDSAPMLSESDPTALALGYKASASSVDTAKFANDWFHDIHTMQTLITGTLILGYFVILIYALWRVAQDPLVRTVTLLPPLLDRDDHDAVPRADQHLSLAPTASPAID